MTEVIKSAFQTLTNEEVMRNIQFGEPLPKEVQNAFNNILELVDDMDVANGELNSYKIIPLL